MDTYYSQPQVRRRMAEFLGGNSASSATAVYIAASDHSADFRLDPRPPHEIWDCFRDGFEISRSLWDRQSLLAHLDIEYVNFDYPAEPYLEPQRSFEIQLPVIRAIQEELLAHGVVPLHLLSGRGHHFVWRIARRSPVFADLVALAGIPPTLKSNYAVAHPPCEERVGTARGAAFVGLGQVLEFVAHRVLDKVAARCEIPVQLTAVQSGPGQRGCEIVSLDLSEYGDPLHTRVIRFPFSPYGKPQQQKSFLGEEIVNGLPTLFQIPLFEFDYREGWALMRDPDRVVDLAHVASVRIPEQSTGTAALLNSYVNSAVGRFHRSFYACEHDSPERWPETYDLAPLDELPLCARAILEQPNELLLKPANLRHLVRTLLAFGWHPRHVAGLVRSKYERDYGWGSMFFRIDAATRADFYTRLFSGLILTGRDRLDDFTCQRALVGSRCDLHQCDRQMDRLRHALCARVEHE